MANDRQTTLEARIAEAEAALHRLMTGSHAVKVGYDGASTEFNRASAPELRRYIVRLKRAAFGNRTRPGSQGVSF